MRIFFSAAGIPVTPRGGGGELSQFSSLPAERRDTLFMRELWGWVLKTGNATEFSVRLQ
jgi:hypothetical protein